MHVNFKDSNDLECLLAAFAIRQIRWRPMSYSCSYRALSSLADSLFSCPQIMLAFSDGKQYDSVYPNSYIESSAICQCKFLPHFYFPHRRFLLLLFMWINDGERSLTTVSPNVVFHVSAHGSPFSRNMTVCGH